MLKMVRAKGPSPAQKMPEPLVKQSKTTDEPRISFVSLLEAFETAPCYGITARDSVVDSSKKRMRYLHIYQKSHFDIKIQKRYAVSGVP